MRKNIGNVIVAWKRGEAHREATCRTDGVTVWSYEMPIARRCPSGRILVMDPSKAPSRTTKMQVVAVRRSVERCESLPGGVSCGGG